MWADGGSSACRITRRSPSTDISALRSLFPWPLWRPSVRLCAPSIHHFPLYSTFHFPKTAPLLSPPLISPLPRQLAGPLPPFPRLHLHLGSTRLPKCFLGVRWLIGSHLLGESGLYGILGNLCQEFYHIDWVFFPPCPEFTRCYLFVSFIVLQQMRFGAVWIVFVQKPWFSFSSSSVHLLVWKLSETRGRADVSRSLL